MSAHEDHREGLAHDLPDLMARGLGRRRLLGLVGGLGVAGLAAACTGEEQVTVSGPTASDASTRPTVAGATATAAGEIPEETAGPYPGDGSNGPDVLEQSGVVREDITRSFGTAAGVAAGVPLTIRLRVLDLTDGESTPLEGAAIYLWHADAAGRYSMYSAGVEDENYLRGVQSAGSDGWLQFQTVFPGCYDGRWPHVHFEVYPSTADATKAANRLRTTQLALPQAVCEKVYATSGYSGSTANLERLSLEGDMVFADGHSLQLATVTGSVAQGLVATLAVPV